MVMAGVRYFWLNRWNDLVDPGQPVCTFAFCLLDFGVVI